MAMVEKDCERVELGPSGGLQFPQWNQLSPEVEAAMSSKSKPQNPQKPNPNPKVPSKIPIAHPPSSFFLSLKFFITCSHQQPPQSSSSSSFLFIFLSIFSPFIPLKPPPPHGGD
ncbi:hypothetical protein Csa_007424 [Cucumis sativus]|uniref:Uncharacterized protein n=1 Tax=Cucumis sativus TaxID=3659 RepID=A0A0A0LXS2_CUCSA|nr:hypothetical protein Csa_007424 [Cucumis sativus]